MNNNATKETIRTSFTYGEQLSNTFWSALVLVFLPIFWIIIQKSLFGTTKTILFIVYLVLQLAATTDFAMCMLKLLNTVSAPESYNMYEAECRAESVSFPASLLHNSYICFEDANGNRQKIKCKAKLGKNREPHTVTIGFDEKRNRWFVMENLKKLNK